MTDSNAEPEASTAQQEPIVKPPLHVWILKAWYQYEGDSLIAIYASEQVANKRKQQLIRQNERHKEWLSKEYDESDPPNCEHSGADSFIVTKERVRRSA